MQGIRQIVHVQLCNEMFGVEEELYKTFAVDAGVGVCQLGNVGGIFDLAFRLGVNLGQYRVPRCIRSMCIM